MAFIRKRISPTGRQTPSYQVVESYREGGKGKQRVIANLGPWPTLDGSGLRGRFNPSPRRDETPRQAPLERPDHLSRSALHQYPVDPPGGQPDPFRKNFLTLQLLEGLYVSQGETNWRVRRR